jgi:hypothetical protein
MKPEMITLKHGDASIKMPASSLAKLAIASVFAQVQPPAANVHPAAPNDIPALDAYWPGYVVNGDPTKTYKKVITEGRSSFQPLQCQ